LCVALEALLDATERRAAVFGTEISVVAELGHLQHAVTALIGNHHVSIGVRIYSGRRAAIGRFIRRSAGSCVTAVG
jgi:hypothetical protein